MTDDVPISIECDTHFTIESSIQLLIISAKPLTMKSEKGWCVCFSVRSPCIRRRYQAVEQCSIPEVAHTEAMVPDIHVGSSSGLCNGALHTYNQCAAYCARMRIPDAKPSRCRKGRSSILDARRSRRKLWIVSSDMQDHSEDASNCFWYTRASQNGRRARGWVPPSAFRASGLFGISVVVSARLLVGLQNWRG